MNKNLNKIAVVGMACRYPGADNIDEFWNNILEGRETIKRFSDEELSKFEHRFDEIKDDPNFIRARGILNDIDQFDAEFFGMTPREATYTDPQHRIWLETAWDAFENAGCDPFNYPGAIGVFTGGNLNTYLLNNILRDPARLENYIRLRRADSFQIMTQNDVMYIPTKTAYKFNLKGPAINVQTTCSTSLVAISMACQSLADNISDMCLAGAICILVPQESGYIYEEGAIHSSEGYVRPFDAKARGTVFSNGVGAVVLKRLDDAIRDHDRIYSVIDGWALNNDGSNKLSYTAPSIDGQAEVIMMAQDMAGIMPDEISYIETHGTGTQLGDPIEIAGLKKAFGNKTSRKQFCGVGSVKSNIGHTDVASGVASFIKASLAAYYKKIPPTINYSVPNPHIDFENSPFYVVDKLKEWDEDKPLIIGVSSFGVGGTNAHVILEEANVEKNTEKKIPEWPSLIMLSAKSENTLAKRKNDLLSFLEANSDLNIQDVAFTLATGRNHMTHRGFMVAEGLDEIISGKTPFVSGKSDNLISSIAFMFPGQGAQYVSMGRDLYSGNLLFREILDECFNIVRSETGTDLKEMLFENPDSEEAEQKLANTEFTQPVLFIIEYALARLYENLGIKPKYMIGHSIGEYTAACLSGVFDLATALKIVIKRGYLMQGMQKGKMYAVISDTDSLKRLNSSSFEIAADNAPNFCTISFITEHTEEVNGILKNNNIQYIPLKTSHAFHSVTCDPILKEFRDFVNKFDLKVPERQFISCLTGKFITGEQATSADYWANQLRNPVMFRPGISTICSNEDVIFLEVGPNTHLSSLVRQNNDVENKNAIITTLGKPDGIDEKRKVISSLGNIYSIGINIDFQLIIKDLRPNKISLPTYPYEKQRYWIDFELNTSSYSQVHKASESKESIMVTDGKPLPDLIDTTDSEPGKISEILIDIWKSLTGLNQIGPDDNFFDLGGQSLLALQIMVRIKEEFKVNISLKSFYDNPTINKLSSLITTDKVPEEHVHEFTTVNSYKNLPLSANQKAIWIYTQFNSSNPAYNIPYTYHFRGNIRTDIFQKSMEILFQRHPIMFSVFGSKDYEPYYDIIPVPVTVNEIDFSDENPDVRIEKIYSFIGEDSRKGFNITTGPLFRIYLLKNDEADFYFHATIHHLIFDGWSWSILIKEFPEIYSSLIAGKSPELEKIEFQYYDYVKLQRETDNSLNEDISRRFWIENLKDCTTILNFPYDHQRKSIPTGFGGKEFINIPPEYTSVLKEISKSESTTLFPTLLSALAILFQRYSGQDDLCIGTATANRQQIKLEKIFGMFVNTTVIRFKIEEEKKFKNFVNQTRDSVLETLSYNDLPFERLVEAVKVKRVSNVNPIFQVALVWLTNSADSITLNGDITGERITVPEGVSPFDITFYLWENKGCIEGEIEYDIDILDRDTIVRLKNNFIKIIQVVTDRPDILLSDISVISDKEQSILVEFNDTKVDIPGIMAHNFFEKCADLNPDNTAVICGESKLTYDEMERQSNQLAGYLVSLGVGAGDVVGVCMERSAEMVVSLLAVMKSGGCYLPLDPSIPDERIKFMVEDSNSKMILSRESLKDKFKVFTDKKVIYIDADNNEIRKRGVLRPDIKIDPQTIAYIIYTSGSTGRPKGVKVHHQALVNWNLSISKMLRLNGEDTLLAISSPSFDMSVCELFCSISNGSTAVLANSNEVADGIQLIKLLDEYNISLMIATPSTWRILLDNGWRGKNNLKGVSGGEALTQKLVQELLPKMGELWNFYGPTETTICSIGIQIQDPSDRILIGRPMDNTMIYILDKYNNILPVGVTGELAIGGLGVSKGYLNRPELTSDRFIKLENNLVIYKTGDLGRFLNDGNIELFGRIDNQVKLRGFRIELEEIEKVISQVDGIKECVLKVQSFDENDDRLVAFMTVDERFKISNENLTNLLKRQLPSYMIPSFFKVIESFPKMTSGKIDKKALFYDPDLPGRDQEEQSESFTELHRQIISIWEGILKIKNIRSTDNFFDIGGNSLLAIRVINKIKEKLGYSLTFKALIENPTISQIGDYIENQNITKPKSIELVHLTDTINLPLSYNQKRIWLISKLHPDIPSYIVPISYQLTGDLDKNLLQEALNIVFKRHHILFSVVKEVDGVPYCDIVPHEVSIEFIDYSNLPESKKESTINNFIESDSKKIFNLTEGPLYRINLIDAGSNQFYFHMTVHHMIFDGWSWQVLVNEINQVYNFLKDGTELVLKEIEFQQYDYAYWEQNNPNLLNNSSLMEFWKEDLKDIIPVLNFPYDFQRQGEVTGKGGRENIKLSPDLSEKIRNISKGEDASLFGTMYGALATLLYKYSGDDDICIGTPVAYRPHSKLENIVGMFVNTVVLRMKFQKDITFRQIVQSANTRLLNALAHQELPFENVVDLVNPERDRNINPIFQVSFAWQNDLNALMNLEGITCRKITEREGISIFDLAFYLWENNDIIEGEIEFNYDLLKRETIERLRTNFLILLEQLTENVDVPVNELKVISDDERQKVLGFTDTFSTYPKDKTINQLFEEQVNLYPSKIAAVFKDESLTYEQLNNKANRLARTLIEHGIKSNEPVGILADKSLEMIVGILGILKAGGGYVPLDPEYPERRLNFIIKDSGCKVLLIQEKYINQDFGEIKKINLDAQASYSVNGLNSSGSYSPSDLAYIMYTSGTTGIPKGSMILQYSVVRLVRNTNYIDLTPDDRILLTGAIVFDATTFEIWGSLLNGGTLYLAEKETILNPRALGEELLNNNITILWLTSPLFTQIAESRTDIFGSLKYLLVGGDIVSADHINKVRKENPQLKVLNAYGPTENTTFSTTYLIDRDYESNIPIGKPISNSTTYIFDRYMNMQPIGVVGELYVGGDGLSKGYLNRDDLNKKSFVDNPYNPGERLYKTGDFARWLPDGNIEFHGRMDNQLKIRGFRVELGEVEAVISELEGVMETVIKPVKVEEGDLRLAAFLNVSESFNMDIKDLNVKIKEKLPQYMVPSAFKIMHGFPKTVNGKIDRDALVLDKTEVVTRGSEDIKSLSSTERKILDIWSEVLRTKDILVTDNFFEIGGNSLLAITVMSKIESAFETELGLRLFFDSPKIKDLAETVDIEKKKLIKFNSENNRGKSRTKMIEGEI